MDPFVGEIMVFAGNFAPKGWALCNGQLMAISQNTALYSLLGTSYGGDGRSTFALPNLQGLVPVQQGQGAGLTQYFLGEIAGSANTTLLQSEMPTHTHAIQASTRTGTRATASGQMLSAASAGGRPPTAVKLYSAAAPAQPLLLQAVGTSGGTQPHNNMMPFVAFTYCIALQGVFPQRS